MTREEYKAKLKGLHPQMDCDLKWKYTQEYIASLEARVAELEQELKNQVELHNEWLGTYRIKLDYIEELERKIKRLTT